MKLFNIYDLSDRFPKLATDVKHLVQKTQDVMTQVEEKRVLDKTEKEVVRRIKRNQELLNYEVFSEAYKTYPLRPHLVVFESNSGKNFTGDVYQLYKSMLHDPRFEDYSFIWIYSSRYELDDLTRYMERDDRVTFVSRADKEYQVALATAGYYFNDEAAPLWYVKREGQVYINAWHSTPMQYMGYDRGFNENNPFPIRSWLRSYLMSDYIISADERTTDVLVRAYKLEHLYRGQFLIGQSPRRDAEVTTNKEQLYTLLSEAGLKVDHDKETLLWVMTTNMTDVEAYQRFVMETEYLLNQVSNRYNVLFALPDKTHQRLCIDEKLTGHLLPNGVDLNEVLALSDVVVSTDSTIFYDVVGTNKPIYFYDFIEKTWENSYFDAKDFASSTVYNIMELCVALMAQQKEAMTLTTDGHISDRYINAIFFNDIQEPLVTRQLEKDKLNLVFYAGNLANNFITYRFLQLLNTMDMDKVDVTLLLSSNDVKQSSFEQLRRISSVVRPIFHQGYAAFTEKEAINDKKIRQYGLIPELQDSYPKEAYMRESKRVFGDVHFDMAIDFQGDDFYWSRYIAESDSDYKVLMQQYDMEHRYNTAVRKKAKHRQASLKSVISYYQNYDQVVMIKRHYDKNRQFAAGADAGEFISYYDISDSDPTLSFDYYEEQNTSEKTQETLSANVQFDNEEAITIYPNIEDMTQSLTVTVNNQTNAVAIAQTEKDGHRYIKLSVDYIYFGWMMADDVNLELANIISDVTTDQYAIVKYPKGHTIYTAPYNTEEDIKMVGSARMLRGIIVHIDREVTTKTATYCRIAIDNEAIGYVDKRALQAINASKAKVASNHHRHQKQIDERLFESEEMDQKAVLKNYDDVILYTKSYGSYQCEESELPAQNLARRPLHVTWKARTKAGVSYEIIDDFNQHAWVKADDLIFES